jgi:hypothetical protein
MFLTRGSIAVAAAGVASSLPMLFEAGDAGTQEAASVVPAVLPAALPEGASLSEPLLAHISDLSSGQISLLVGQREIVFNDPSLVARLYQASR